MGYYKENRQQEKGLCLTVFWIQRRFYERLHRNLRQRESRSSDVSCRNNVLSKEKAKRIAESIVCLAKGSESK